MIKQIKTFLERWGIHSFLLPVFFILHSYKQYYGLVSSNIAIEVFFEISLILLALFLMLFAITRHLNKSLQLTTLVTFIFLFFGVIKDFFQITLHIGFLAKYSILLPLLLIIVIILIRIIYKKKKFRRSNLFQNLLLLIFILIDSIGLMVYNNHHSLNRNLLTRNNNIDIDSLPKAVSKPNVYYLLFDSYPGDHFLKDYMHYDNSSFSEALKEKGFYVLNNPRSNYNRTAFSVASILNFQYLKNIKNFSPITPKDYNKARLTIKYSIVPKIFEHYNYTFYNLSVFDINNIPSIRSEDFLTLPEKKVLLFSALIERLKGDVLWNFAVGKYAIPFIQKIYKRDEEENILKQVEKRDFNNNNIDSLMKIPFKKTIGPKFIYAHFYLPHPPFFYDENGKANNLEYVLTEESLINRNLFLAYLKYSNKIILELMEKIIKVSGNNSVVIVQSDHGFRDFKDGCKMPQLFFKNYSAFYFPDKNYSTLYDTMSNINTFPMIFNKYFGTKIPMKQDTSVFLAY
jgi:hypothetical protein